MDNFSFCLPETNLLFGRGTLQEAGARARRNGSHALLVSGKGAMRKAGFLQKCEKSLKDAGMKVTLFEGVEPNPTVKTVNAGIKLGLGEGCDVVVAIGGGSAIDAAKGIAVGIGHADGDIWAYVCREKETTKKTLPIVAIPSTSGTGSHVTWYTVITNEGTKEKAAYSSKFMFPKESIVDIDIVSTMPRKVTAETGFDALAHAMETYLSSGASPMTDLLAVRAMELIAQNLPRAYGVGDMDARWNMALADTYAGICITPSRTIMVHGIGNTVSGIYPQVSHGEALACLSGPVMRFNIQKGDERTVSRYCDIARALGMDVTNVDKENAMKSVEAVEKLLKGLGLSTKMSEYGADERGIEQMTEYSMRFGVGAIGCNPVKPTRADIVRIYKEAL
jgi:alcohol dehydrogenase class IV